MKYIWCGVCGTIGFLFGFSICYSNWAVPAQHSFEDMFYVSVLADLETGQKIHEGKELEISKAVESRIPKIVMSINRDFDHHPGAKYFLWRIKMYFKKTGVEVPTSIRETMFAVPDTQPGDEYIFYNQAPNDPFADIKTKFQRVLR